MRKFVDWFLVGMAAAVLLAFLFPDAGSKGGWLHAELLTKLGVALIFFLHGLSLPFASLQDGAKRWRLHVVIQATTFLVFPILGWVAMSVMNEDSGLKTGIFFLCVLPSTVSSSVALTATARGNVAVAVFNATLSSLLGIFLTPLWMTLVPHDAQMIPFGEVVVDLMKWLLLPLIMGQFARPIAGSWAARNKKTISRIDRTTILLLVYTSFCDSVKWGIWQDRAPVELLSVATMVAVLFFMVFLCMGALCDRLGFDREDRIAAIFCGSKKSLAQGVPMAQLIFAGNPAIGLVLLPIMLYHPLQLIICGILASRWARQADQRPSAG